MEIRHEVAGEPVVIHVAETEDDIEPFRDFIRANKRCLGLDTETTGLDIYSDSFRCRTVQFGNAKESWVLPVELSFEFCEEAKKAFEYADKFVIHNAAFDLQVIEQCFGIPMEKMWPKAIDTKILAHLVNPVAKDEGGIGHSLEELTREYIDSEVADSVKSLMRDLAAETKGATTNTIWAKIDVWHPHYLKYAGMDPILASRLASKLAPLVPAESEDLVGFEHRVAEVCSYYERTGFLLDVDYSKQLANDLKYKESLAKEVAMGYGCEKVSSTDQVADVLEALGVKILGRTPSGKRQVNDDLLTETANGDNPQAAEFAKAVAEAKRAGKWRKTWVDTFLRTRDAKDRCHAAINPLRARTARMSISGIPAQTLPAGDWTIRRCFIADPGESIASVDYQAQELRVLAALSGDRTMIEAFRNGLDLHQITADAAGVERSVGKMANFQKVYGGGAAALATAAHISFPVAQKVHQAFSAKYPEVDRLSRDLQKRATQDGYIVTGSGRRLPVDEDRAYSSLNYLIQSTSRDVTARALLRLHDEGYTPYVRLPIHDEVLCSVPEDYAGWGAAQVGKIMTEWMGPVRVGTDPSVYGKSWGHGYMKEEG